MNRESAGEAMIAAFRDTALSSIYKHKVEKFLPEIKPWLKSFILHYEAQRFDPIAVEEEFNFKYRNITMVGRIDRIDNVSPSKIRIVDYKTTKNPNYLTDMQLGIYNIGVKYGSLSDRYGSKDIEACYVLLRHDMRDTPYYFTMDQLIHFLDEAESAADQIAGDVTWEAKPSNLCQSCDFFIPCTQKENGEEEWECCDES
jgi:RecB family exonuclease